jgi:flagellar biosynthesis regulator FlbT
MIFLDGDSKYFFYYVKKLKLKLNIYKTINILNNIITMDFQTQQKELFDNLKQAKGLSVSSFFTLSLPSKYCL